MANGIINLILKSASIGSGFDDVQKKTDSLIANTNDLSNAARTLGKAFGNAGNLVGQMFSNILKGGIWGAAAQGVSFAIGKIIDKVKEHNELMKDAKLAAQGLSREYETLEFRAKAYARRVAEWNEKAAAAKKAESEGIRARKEALRLEHEALIARRDAEKSGVEFRNKQLEIDKLIADEEERIKINDEDLVAVAKARAAEMRRAADVAVEAAKNNLEYQKKWGGIHGQDEAAAALRLAEARRERIRRDAASLVYKADVEEAKRAADKIERNDKEAAAKRQSAAKREAAERIAALREEHKARMEAIDKEISKARDEAKILEETAARARGGKTFGEWQRGERQIAREERRRNARQANVIRAAENEAARLENEQRRFGRAFNPARAARLAKLREFLADQNPANNPALKRAEALEKKRRDLEAKLQKDVADIAKALVNGGVNL